MTDENRNAGQADRQLDAILSRVSYIGPQPEPSEDEVMDMVVEAIHAVRVAKDARTAPKP